MPRRDEIAAFAAEYLSVRPERIDWTDILHSVGCDGDDAFEFIEAFGQQYNVDLSDYLWEFHHEDEGALLTGWRLFRSPHGRLKRIPIGLDLLEASAHERRWTCTYPAHKPMSWRYDIWLDGFFLVMLTLMVFIALVLIFGPAIH